MRENNNLDGLFKHIVESLRDEGFRFILDGIEPKGKHRCVMICGPDWIADIVNKDRQVNVYVFVLRVGWMNLYNVTMFGIDRGNRMIFFSNGGANGGGRLHLEYKT